MEFRPPANTATLFEQVPHNSYTSKPDRFR